MNLPNDPFIQNSQNEANYVRLDNNPHPPIYPPMQNYFQPNPNLYSPHQPQSQYIPFNQQNHPSNAQYIPPLFQNELQTGNLQSIPSEKLASKIKAMALTVIIQNLIIIFFLLLAAFILFSNDERIFFFIWVAICSVEGSLFYCLWSGKVRNGKSTYISYLSFRNSMRCEMITIFVIVGIVCGIFLLLELLNATSSGSKFLSGIFLAFAGLFAGFTFAFFLPRIIALCIYKEQLNLPQILNREYGNQIPNNEIVY